MLKVENGVLKITGTSQEVSANIVAINIAPRLVRMGVTEVLINGNPATLKKTGKMDGQWEIVA